MMKYLQNSNLFLIITLLFLSTTLSNAHEKCEKNVFVEKDGYVVFEAENTTLNDYWLVANSFDEDALGEGHIEYQGKNSYGSVVEESIITYKIQITNPGTYRVKWRSRNGKNAVKFDEENDSWLMVEAAEFYGIKASTNKKVNSDHHFMKMWIQDLNKWSWNCFGEHAGVNGMNVYARFDVPGVYEIKVSGRSKFHPIDRIALFQEGKGAVAMANATPAMELECEDDSFREFASARQYDIKQLDEKIVIDGEEETLWDYVSVEKGNYEVNEQAVTATDLSYTFKMAYDMENLYILANVIDDNVQEVDASSSKENGDAIELYFNQDNEHLENGAYDEGDVMLRLFYGDPAFKQYRSKKDINFDGFEYATSKTADGYLLEAKIPWTVILDDASNLELSKIGFEMSVLDRDINLVVENELNWANNTGINAAKEDTRKFGTIYLQEWTYNYPFKTDWEVIYVDSEDTKGVAENAIDDDMTTFWHTEWRDQKAAIPHEIQIDMKSEYVIEELHYYNRQDAYGPNGAIGEYEIYLSNSSSDWGEAVATGTLDWGSSLVENYKMLQKIVFDKPHTGQFLRIVALTEAQNNAEIPFTAAAEFYVVAERTDEVLSADLQQELQLKVYPNPASHQVYIQSKLGISNYKIFNSKMQNLQSGLLDQSQVIDLQKLPSGLYFLYLETNDRILVKKLYKK
ncbi:sugar-binding protein [Flammeovirga aprica]|uniref:T9SS type A sorting domain-containing protein n=1 Tax=Flammeovirga aprica JL-4 TaxID=694437 RepID=A0A7X9XBQ4_9BACT|nr:sugar-binding protein [Flammeovirga aprica]NME70991.1 T9SS type A sorting domain-containing protein [Flammeovirga aprica JL-4]